MQLKSHGTKVPGVRVGPRFITVTNALFNCNIKPLANAYTKIANRFMRTNGPKWTCQRLKDYYNVGIHISLGINVPSIPFCKTRSSIPIDLYPFLPMLSSPRVNERRAALTVLRSFQQIHCKVDEDTSTIENPGPEESLFEDYKDSFREITEKYKYFLDPKIKDEGLYTTSKRGPNGPAMQECDKDYVACLESGLIFTILELNDEITKIAIPGKGREVKVAEAFAPEYDNYMNPDHEISRAPRSVRKLEMYRAMEDYIAWREEYEPGCYDNCHTSKLGFLSEGGCKTRIFAIGDYWSQDALKPIHRCVYKMLNRLVTDGTSSHNRISQLVRDKTSKGMPVSSFDLTAFTDRFPIFIQEFVMGILFNPDLARVWRKILTDRDFYCEGRLIRYNCGQPMGLLSSWAVAALTHHITVEACAYKVGFPNFRDYCLIGDDVTIFNPLVAQEYRRFLNHFSIKISEAKSLSSSGKPSSAEIAKRIFKDGEELSPLPYDAIESAVKDYLLFPNLLRLAMERGIDLSTLDTPVQSTLSAIYPKGTKADKVMTILAYPCHSPGFPVTDDRWKGWDDEVIFLQMVRTRYEYVSKKVKDMYHKDLLTLPDMGPLGVALESDTAPKYINRHPLLVVLRNYRDRCGSIYLKVAARRVTPADLENLDFLVSPLIPQYMRRTHRVERINSSLILKAFKALSDATANA